MKAKLTYLLYVPIIMGLLALGIVVSRAFAHDTEIVKCDRNLKIASVAKLKEAINENGTVSEIYDRNGDGRIDIEAISYIKGVVKNADGSITYEHDPHPFVYIVDTNLDGEPDAVYVDRSGVGKCDEIVLYKDLSSPSLENKDERSEGRL